MTSSPAAEAIWLGQDVSGPWRAGPWCRAGCSPRAAGGRAAASGDLPCRRLRRWRQAIVSRSAALSVPSISAGSTSGSSSFSEKLEDRRPCRSLCGWLSKTFMPMWMSRGRVLHGQFLRWLWRRNDAGGPDVPLAFGLGPGDRRHDLAIDVVHGQRPGVLEADHALGIDDEGLGHAIDAPVDRGAAVAVGADGVVGIAELRRGTPRRCPARPSG